MPVVVSAVIGISAFSVLEPEQVLWCQRLLGCFIECRIISHDRQRPFSQKISIRVEGCLGHLSQTTISLGFVLGQGIFSIYWLSERHLETEEKSQPPGTVNTERLTNKKFLRLPCASPTRYFIFSISSFSHSNSRLVYTFSVMSEILWPTMYLMAYSSTP